MKTNVNTTTKTETYDLVGLTRDQLLHLVALTYTKTTGPWRLHLNVPRDVYNEVVNVHMSRWDQQKKYNAILAGTYKSEED